MFQISGHVLRWILSSIHQISFTWYSIMALPKMMNDYLHLYKPVGECFHCTLRCKAIGRIAEHSHERAPLRLGVVHSKDSKDLAVRTRLNNDQLVHALHLKQLMNWGSEVQSWPCSDLYRCSGTRRKRWRTESRKSWGRARPWLKKRKPQSWTSGLLACPTDGDSIGKSASLFIFSFLCSLTMCFFSFLTFLHLF